ncbi:MAG: hypothetical protein Q7S76_04195 [bacterium]|nr:hypothetical protein [bacterium]
MKKALALGLGVSALLVFVGFLSKSAINQNVANQNNTANDDTISEPESGNPVSGLRLGKNAIVVYDQKPGLTLKIATVVTEKSGFIGIHEATERNLPGKLLGNSEQIEGYLENAEVLLSSATVHGQKLIAVIYEDNGNGRFEPEEDSLIEDGIGNPLGMVFMISSDADSKPPKSVF